MESENEQIKQDEVSNEIANYSTDISELVVEAYDDWVQINGLSDQLLDVKRSNSSQHMIAFNLPLVAKFIKLDRTTTETSAKIENELKFLRRLDHPNIIKYFEGFKRLHSTDEFRVIVYEYAELGNLEDFMVMNFNLESTGRENIAMQIVQGVNYLHELRICHRNIRPTHIVLSSTLRAKILHFVDAVEYTKEEMDANFTSYIGSISYASPEAISLNEGASYSGKATDVWALGMTIFYVACNQHYFESDEQAKEQLKNWEFKIPAMNNLGMPINLDETCVQLLKNIFQINVASRLSAREIEVSEWLVARRSINREL